MAEIYAVQNGNWSDGSTWSSGTVPTADDDVFLQDYEVTVQQSLIDFKTLSNRDHTGRLLFPSSIKSYTFNGTIYQGDSNAIIYNPNNSAYFNFKFIVNGDVYSNNIQVIDSPVNQNFGITVTINGNAEGCILRSDTQWGNRDAGIYINGDYTLAGTAISVISGQGTLWAVFIINGNFSYSTTATFNTYRTEVNGKMIINAKFQSSTFVINGECEINSGINVDNFDFNNTNSIKFIDSEFYNKQTFSLTYPQENQVAQGVTYGMQNEYEGRLQLPAEGVVVKGVEYGNKVGTLEVIALSGATATADNISVVNLTEQEVNRVKNCATVSTVQKCFEEFKEE